MNNKHNEIEERQTLETTFDKRGVLSSGSTCNSGAGSRAQYIGAQWCRDPASNLMEDQIHIDTILSPIEHE
jgi:hypothetical protein